MEGDRSGSRPFHFECPQRLKRLTRCLLPLVCREFAGWIATIHHQPCHVVYTDYRPVPLQVGPLASISITSDSPCPV